MLIIMLIVEYVLDLRQVGELQRNVRRTFEIVKRRFKDIQKHT